MSLLLTPCLAACSKDDLGDGELSMAEAHTKRVRASGPAGYATVEMAGLPAGTYVVETGVAPANNLRPDYRHDFRGDTLTLLPSVGTLSATLAPPGAGPGAPDRYTGLVELDGPGRVRLSLDCRCRVGTTAFGQPRYDTVVLSGTFHVHPSGRGRFTLANVDAGRPYLSADTSYTIVKVR